MNGLNLFVLAQRLDRRVQKRRCKDKRMTVAPPYIHGRSTIRDFYLIFLIYAAHVRAGRTAIVEQTMSLAHGITCVCMTQECAFRGPDGTKLHLESTILKILQKVSLKVKILA
jgi:hypothetical protein